MDGHREATTINTLRTVLLICIRTIKIRTGMILYDMPGYQVLCTVYSSTYVHGTNVLLILIDAWYHSVLKPNDRFYLILK